MVAAPVMLLIAGKTCVPPVPYLRISRAFVTRPINRASPKKWTKEMDSSSLVRFSAAAEVGRFEHFVFLFLALVCGAFCFC